MTHRAVAVFLDDFGAVGDFRTVTQEELDAMNQSLDDRGVDEFGHWFWLHELSSKEGHA